MNYKPDESILISYLYGELDGQEKEKLLMYFQEHPEELIRLQERANVRKIMGALNDKEVIAPPIFTEGHPREVYFWRSAYFKTVLSIAASFLLLLLAGRLLGTEVNYSRGELQISFGGKRTEKPVLKEQQILTPAEIQNMINASLVKNTASLSSGWADHQKSMDQSIRLNLDRNSRKVDDLIRNTSQVSQDQLRSYVAGLQDENLRIMKNYFQLSSTEQKKYVEGLLVDFSRYLQEQRNQDLQLVQTRVNSIEKNSDQFKQQTEQILAGIISNSTVKKNSY